MGPPPVWSFPETNLPLFFLSEMKPLKGERLFHQMPESNVLSCLVIPYWGRICGNFSAVVPWGGWLANMSLALFQLGGYILLQRYKNIPFLPIFWKLIIHSTPENCEVGSKYDFPHLQIFGFRNYNQREQSWKQMEYCQQYRAIHKIL